MKNILGTLIGLVLLVPAALGETFLVEGRMATRLKVRSEKAYIPEGSIKELTLQYTRYPNRTLGANKQKILSETEEFSLKPKSQTETEDPYGNIVVRAVFGKIPPEGLVHTRLIEAELEARPGLNPSGESYPPEGLDKGLKPYLEPSELVQSDHPKIRDTARGLIQRANSQSYEEVVSTILNFVVVHLRGELSPPSKDALWALETGRGNCQCYSHLSAALLRAAGIPARVAVGLATKKAWTFEIPQGKLTQDNAEGLHAWLEVYFPSVGWVPGDPQQTHNMVASRLLTQCQGPDASLIVDRAEFAGSGSIKRKDKLEVEFPSDVVDLRTVGRREAPKNYMVDGFKAGKSMPPPAPTASSTPVPPTLTWTPQPSPEPTLAPKRTTPLPSDPTAVRTATPQATAVPTKSQTRTPTPQPTPRGEDILDVLAKLQKDRDRAEQDQLRKNGYLGFTDKDAKPGDEFAQDMDVYATGDKMYAQKFTVPTDFNLKSVELALCKFGGEEGSLWVELREDRGGRPGMGATDVVSSRALGIGPLKFDRSYPWTRFSGFAKRDSIPLKAGSYWIVLRYSGDAIFNWRCQMGNYYGDNEDTRAGDGRAPTWKEVLNVDLNFKVVGTPQ